MGAEEQMIGSIVKAVDVLELVGNSHEGLRLRHVAKVLGISRQSAYKVLSTLVHKKFLTKLGSPPRYKLGLAMQALQDRQDRWTQEFLIPGITKAIRLARVAPSYVAIYQYVGGEVVSRFHSRGGDSGTPWTSYGTLVPPYGAAVLFQAYMNDSQRQRFQARHPMTAEADLEYWKSLELMNGVLELVREEGHLALLKTGNFRAAAPVFGRDGHMEAAVVITRTFANMQPGDPQRYTRLVREAADELSAGAEAAPLP